MDESGLCARKSTVRRAAQNTNQPSWLLRPCCSHPRRSAREKRDEIPPPHCRSPLRPTTCKCPLRASSQATAGACSGRRASGILGLHFDFRLLGLTADASPIPRSGSARRPQRPSKTHPRFEARSVFHCVTFSIRYHGDPALVASSMDIHFLPRIIVRLDFCRVSALDVHQANSLP